MTISSRLRAFRLRVQDLHPRLRGARSVFLASALCLGCSDSSADDESNASATLGGAGPVYFGPPLEGSLGPDAGEHDNPWLKGGGTSSGGARGAPPENDEAAVSKERDKPKAPADPGILLLDMYEETRGAEKYLGLRHVGGGSTGPTECVVEVYSNGGTTPYRRPTVPALAPGERVELCTKSATRVGCVEALGSAPFNGNDALVVRCAGLVVDSFGQVGHDPGAAWRANGVSSQDQALVRCGDERDTDPFDPFVIDASWRTWSAGEPFEAAQAGCSPADPANPGSDSESGPDSGSGSGGGEAGEGSESAQGGAGGFL